MAAVAPSADQAADLLQTMTLDSQSKSLDFPEPKKKSSVNSSATEAVQVQPYNRSVTPSFLPDINDPNSSLYFPGAYQFYPGAYDGTTDWGDYSKYANTDGVDMTGVYGDIYSAGFGYGYPPYSPATSPVPTLGHDGQLYGAQQYQYPTPFFQPLTPTSGPYSANGVAPLKGEISTSGATDQASLSVDTSNGNPNGIVNAAGVKGNNNAASGRQTTYPNFNANGSYAWGTQNAYQDYRYGFDGSVFSNGQVRPVTSTPFASSASNVNSLGSRNQNLRPQSNGWQNSRSISGLNSANQYVNSMFPGKLYNQYGNTYRNGYGYGSNTYDARSNGRGWYSVDNKYKPRGRGNGFFGYGNENMDGLNELNRGPRAKITKNEKDLTPIVLAKGQDIPLPATGDAEKEKASAVLDREQYNKADFPETYADAKFFIIKSYSEDDVHKSVKYGVWASTQNGNKKLDAAYQESQQKSGECPVFLFFSVNTSGQFVGVAEMVGPVDFNKSLEYWQQDKWIGCFPVKWVIVKDVPNSLLKHITLENNENKPVTNSRDTQEVKLEPGLQMLKIFKEHSSKQCILDDFEFYEDRQKKIQEKKAKQQQFQKQIWDGKQAADDKKDASKVEVLPPKSADTVSSELVKDTTPVTQTTGGEIPDNGSLATSVDLPNSSQTVGDVPAKGSKPVEIPEKTGVNGVANGF